MTPHPKCVEAAEKIAEYEERHYGPISPGYPGPSKHTQIKDIAQIIADATQIEKLEVVAREVVDVIGHCPSCRCVLCDAMKPLGAALAEVEKVADESSFISLPDDLRGEHDMLVGPCLCGAWHKGEHVFDALRRIKPL